MRKNEHPACSCAACKRGKGTCFGQLVHKAVNRKIRRKTKQVLKKENLDEFIPVVISTPYTD